MNPSRLALSPKGATYVSPGQRPGWPSHLSPNGASHASPGQRPGWPSTHQPKALKGRSKPCRNHWPVFIFTSSSARRIANPSSPIPSATHCTPTWPPCCKISVALRFLSIPWKTTPTCFSTWPERFLSAKSSKMLKNPLPNGSRPKDRNSPHLHGNQDTVHLPFRNPMLKPSANTSPTNASTTTGKPFKRNIGHSCNAITLCSMNDTCGIDRRDIAHLGVAHQGVALQGVAHQGVALQVVAHQGVALQVVALQGVAHQGVALRYLDAGALPLQSPNGASYASPGHRPGYARRPLNLGLKARPNGRTVRPQGVALRYLDAGALPLQSPNGASYASPGQRPGYARRSLNLGLKARPNGRTVRPQGVALRYLDAGALPLQSPNGAPYASPGQRPGYGSKRTDQALKGRPKQCPNPRPNGRTVRPGFQPSISFQSEAQGVALGYLKTGALPLKMERKLL